MTCRYYNTAGVRILFDGIDSIRDLVYDFAVFGFPATPLFTVYRTEIAVFVGPFIPDPYTIVFQVFNIRITLQEPEQFVNNGFQVQLLGSYQWKAFLQIKT